ncbi:MAG: preprotein translocase subunit SecA [Candidatus Komeilibacteria bacterium]|nr:preprotein translocase subunit SecA [Candidatus Komeilibacteria bacterium]
MFKWLFPDANIAYVKKLQPLVEQINALEADYQKLSHEQLREKTTEFKNRLDSQNSLDELLPEAFAVIREAARRTLGQRHFDVQLLGGIVLHNGQIAEMRTGEGKTLTATTAVYLNALTGKGVHVITVNDYLAKRDAVWMGQIYNYLGLSVSCLQHESAFLYAEPIGTGDDAVRDIGVKVDMSYLKPIDRKQAYAADITYGTNHEFGFDYLRDNLAQTTADMVQRPFYFAIIDEVDSILIDEARTPLIISAPAEESTEKYLQFAQLIRRLTPNTDYNIDEKLRAATLTEEGIAKMEKLLNTDNIYQTHGMQTVHHLEQSLKAEALFKRDKDYVVKDGEVVIVDEFTGRLMFGRRYSEGLHQAIEAKEGLKVQRESRTLASVTLQNYFRLYPKLSGMTGTAATEAEEFHKIYNLEVTIIPTNQPMVRQDGNDSIYKTEHGKFLAVVNEIKARHAKGQPVLVGTISIEKNEVLSEMLNQEGITHELLNAKHHEREAEIIAQAGKVGAVTIATNMAGRGVDIILGGNPATPDEARKVREVGGLHIIGTERHESRRIDNQLRGRAGRQGDPGSTQFFISLEDDLMRIFGGDRLKSIMNTMRVPEDMPIENGLISKSIEAAQRKVEGNNFDIRKHLVDYDDIINKHREVVYKKRRQILELSEGNSNEEYQNLTEFATSLVGKEIEQVVSFHTASENMADWNIKEIKETTKTIFPVSEGELAELDKFQTQYTDHLHQRTELIETLIGWANIRLESLGQAFGQQPEFKSLERPLDPVIKYIAVQSLDNLWMDHLESIDYLRASIGLRGYGQRDPLVEYKRESYQMLQQLLDAWQNQVVYSLFKFSPAPQVVAQTTEPKKLKYNTGGEAQTGVTAHSDKVGRNDLCPCGSGKKFKKCHGQ